MKRALLILAVLLCVGGKAKAQGGTQIASFAADPATCVVGMSYYNTTSNVLKTCGPANTWSTAGGTGLPAGPTTPNNRAQLCGEAPVGGVAPANCTWSLFGDSPTDRPSNELSYPIGATDIGTSIRETNAAGEAFTIPDGNTGAFVLPVNIGFIIQGGTSTIARTTSSQIRCTPNGALANSCSLTVGAQYILKETSDFNYTLSVSGDVAPAATTGCTSGCNYVLGLGDDVGVRSDPGVALNTANQGVYVRFFNALQRKLSNACVNISVASAGGNADVGLYSVSGGTGTRQWHTGSFSTTSAVVLCFTPTAYTMAGGANFYLAWCADNTTVTLNTFMSNANSFNGGASAPANTSGIDATDGCTAGVLPSTITITNIANNAFKVPPYVYASN